MNVVLLMNPRAASGRLARDATALVDALSTYVTLEVLAPVSAAAARRECEQALQRGTEAMVVAGGDGTFHNALQVVAERPVPMAIILAGTCNDLSASLRVPMDPLAAVHAAGQGLSEGRYAPLDRLPQRGPALVRHRADSRLRGHGRPPRRSTAPAGWSPPLASLGVRPGEAWGSCGAGSRSPTSTKAAPRA